MSLSKNALCVIALLVLASCAGSPVEPEDYEFGRIDVYVRDAAGQPINGVQVRLDKTNGQTEDPGGPTGTAGPAGYYFFLKTKGNYRVVITPPAAYELAAGQSASIAVTFTKDQTKTLNFVLRSV